MTSFYRHHFIAFIQVAQLNKWLTG